MNDNHDADWEIIAGKIHGELNSTEETELHQAITDHTYRHEFEKAQQIHDNLVKIESIPAEGMVESWKKVEKGIKINQLRWIQETLKYAAIIVTAYIAGNVLKPVPESNNEIRYTEVRAPRTQMSKVTLPDGTIIWLNSGTTIRYPDRFTDKIRSVSLSGEAYFEVARMADKPFIVITSDMKVKVFGTSFNVSAYQDDETTSVTLVEGKVDVQNSAGKTIAQLNPGQLAVKNKKEPNVNLQNVETSFYKAWIDGRIYFDDQPLNEIAVKLERWFNVDILFANERLKSYRFTGTILKNKPVDQIMQALELLAPISFKHQINTTGKDKITIYKRT